MPITISDKVGILCINRHDDVAKIQDALNRVSPTEGRAVPPLIPNGVCDKKTTDAIQKFQLKQFGWPGADGKIFPGGQTITRINQLLPDTPGPITPPKQTGVRWRLEFNTGKSNSLSKLEPWFLFFTDLDENRSWRFRLAKSDVSSEQKLSFNAPHEFTTDPMTALDLDGAIFRYDYYLNYKGLPPIPDVAGNLPFFEKTERSGSGHFHLLNGHKFWLLNMPLRIIETDLRANQPGVYTDYVIGRLKNTSK